jgi:sugar phosphate isomerase/epimerase
MTRRSLFAAPAALLPSASSAAPSSRRNPIGVSTYSYWHFTKEKYPIEKVIDNAARIGFDGVEILHRQMENETPAYCNALKRRAFSLGLDLYMLSIHQNFVSPDPKVRKENIDHTVRCIQLAARLGIPAIRLNSGRWGTIKSFDDLMKVKGNEPPLAGFTNDHAFQWCIDSIGECLPHAEREGVLLALENHWGLTTQPEGVLRIHKAVNSTWLGINMDTGNYATDPYPEIEKLAPQATIVQAKTYYGGGVWYTLDLDYPRIAGILKKHNFRGWISLEMEGKAEPGDAVARSFEVLRSAFA